MTLTDSPPTEVDIAPEAASVEELSQPQGLAGPVTTADGAAVGRLFVGTSLLLALGTAVIGVLLALEQLGATSPDDIFAGLNAHFQMWSLYRMSFVLLVVMPLLIGVAMVVVPSQIGKQEVQVFTTSPFEIVLKRSLVTVVWAES